MRENLTEIVCILDASGSMGAIRDDAVGGFNTFIQGQKEAEGDANVTVIFFDSNTYTKWQESVNVMDFPVLGNEYVPGCATPLLDSVGKTINEVGARLDALPEEEKPGKVVVLIITDGQENCSSEFTKDQIKKMIEHQEEAYQWTFAYLGADVNAFGEAAGMGISIDNTASYTGSAKGIRTAYAVASSNLGVMRSGGSDNMGFGGDIPEDDSK